MAKRIAVAVVLAPLFFVVLFFFPPWCLAAVMAVIAALASYELLTAANVKKSLLIYISTAVSAAAIQVSALFYESGTIVLLVLLLLMCITFLTAISRYEKEQQIPYEQIMICLFGGAIIPVMLSSLVLLKTMPNGKYLVLLPVICAFLTDSGAYFAGVFFGKHKGITRVSPHKSLEGYVGGILSGCIFLLLYGLVLQRFTELEVSFPLMAAYGLLGSAVTELGDLSFSFIKRQTGVKDYGTLLPGHGGMLDRFDSMVFAGPTLLLLVTLTTPFKMI